MTSVLDLSLAWAVSRCRQYQDGQCYSLCFLTLFFPVKLKADCLGKIKKKEGKKGEEISVYCLSLLFGCLASANAVAGKVWRES